MVLVDAAPEYKELAYEKFLPEKIEEILLMLKEKGK